MCSGNTLANGLVRQRVKDMFVEIGVGEKYRKYEEESYRKIPELIDGIDESIGGGGGVGVANGKSDGGVKLKEIFRAFLEKICGRTK
jgi:hypothetical protein